MKERAVNSIIHWIGCDKQDAEMIFNGVWRLADGNNYSAFYTHDGKLEICKNGFAIHRLIMI